MKHAASAALRVLRVAFWTFLTMPGSGLLLLSGAFGPDAPEAAAALPPATHVAVAVAPEASPSDAAPAALVPERWTSTPGPAFRKPSAGRADSPCPPER